MVNYAEENGITIPASKTEAAEEKLSNLELAISDVAQKLGLDIKRYERKDDATSYLIYRTTEKVESKELGLFKKRTVQTKITHNQIIGMMYVGLNPLGGHEGKGDKCPLYLTTQEPSSYYIYNTFFGGDDIRDESNKPLETFSELKKLGTHIHNKLGNNVMLDTLETWRKRVKNGFETKIIRPNKNM
jgi:hypothetical protein